MSKLAIETQHIVEVFRKGYGALFSTSLSKVQPQMPKSQLGLFLKQSVKKQQRIIIQVNPTTHSDQFNLLSSTHLTRSSLLIPASFLSAAS